MSLSAYRRHYFFCGFSSMVTLSMVPVNGKGDAYHGFLYVEYEGGEVGYYDLARGPFELRNIAPTLALDLLQRLHPVLQANMSCTGARACQDAHGRDSGGTVRLPRCRACCEKEAVVPVS